MRELRWLSEAPGWRFTRKADLVGKALAALEGLPQIQAQLAASERDTARLDWLDREQAEVAYMGNGRARCWAGIDVVEFGDHCRAAIDAAMAAAVAEVGPQDGLR